MSYTTLIIQNGGVYNVATNFVEESLMWVLTLVKNALCATECHVLTNQNNKKHAPKFLLI